MATKQKMHMLSDNHPIIAALLYAYIGIFAIEIAASIINYPIGLLIPAYPKNCGIVGILFHDVISYIISAPDSNENLIMAGTV